MKITLKVYYDCYINLYLEYKKWNIIFQLKYLIQKK